MSYVLILRRLRQTKFQRKVHSEKLILAIVVTFGIFWLPYHIINMIQVGRSLFLASSLVILIFNSSVSLIHTHTQRGILKDLFHFHFYSLKGGSWVVPRRFTHKKRVSNTEHINSKSIDELHWGCTMLVSSCDWWFNHLIQSPRLRQNSTFPHHMNCLTLVNEKCFCFCRLVRVSTYCRAVTSAFAFTSSCANPVLYTFAGKSYIKQHGFAFMARLFEGTSLDQIGNKKSRIARKENLGNNLHSSNSTAVQISYNGVEQWVKLSVNHYIVQESREWTLKTH